ncbi:MAG: hypothetical protein AB7N80_02325 [Bdellovibrionales bacterium]
MNFRYLTSALLAMTLITAPFSSAQSQTELEKQSPKDNLIEHYLYLKAEGMLAKEQVKNAQNFVNELMDKGGRPESTTVERQALRVQLEDAQKQFSYLRNELRRAIISQDGSIIIIIGSVAVGTSALVGRTGLELAEKMSSAADKMIPDQAEPKEFFLKRWAKVLLSPLNWVFKKGTRILDATGKVVGRMGVGGFVAIDATAVLIFMMNYEDVTKYSVLVEQSLNEIESLMAKIDVLDAAK